MYTYVKKTRAWYNPGVTDTIVQFRTDVTPFIYIHSNVGWLPIGNCPSDPEKAEKLAERTAKGYNLIEAPEDYAKHLAGWTD
jgi:hypothetical protein